MEDLKKSFLVRGNNIVGFSDKNFSTAPIGTVLSFAGNTIPHGYLLADGASYKVADYPDLYAVIGNTYGGDTENFNVPNLVDKFIEGSTTSGTEKEAGLPNITGSFVPWAYQNSLNPSGAFSQSYTNVSAYDEYGANKGSQINFNASQSNSIYGNSDTVQPPALTMVYIIKAFHTNEGVDSGVSDDVIEYVNNSLVDKADKSYVDDNFATMDKITQPIGFKTSLLNQCWGYYTKSGKTISVHMKFVLSNALSDWQPINNTKLPTPSSALTKSANGKTGATNSVYIYADGAMSQAGGGGMSAGTYEFDFEYTTV